MDVDVDFQNIWNPIKQQAQRRSVEVDDYGLLSVSIQNNLAVGTGVTGSPNESIPTTSEAIPATSESIPVPNESISAPNESIPAPNESIPAPNESIPAPNESIPAPNESIPAPNESIHAPNESIPAPNESTPAASIGIISFRDIPGFSRNKDDTGGVPSSTASVTSSFAEELESRFLANRHEIVKADGSINTPLAVLREVARDFGTAIHMEFHEIHISQSERRYRVETYVGRIKGCGEACRRKLAMHIAAADVLEKVKHFSPAQKIPVYALMPGCRINPSIFADLLYLCDGLNLPAPLYVEMPLDPTVADAPLYTYKCQIGQLICIGYSDSRYLARRWAAKKVFEALTGELIPLDQVTHGAYCSALDQFKIKPITSMQKVGILKYREDTRVASSLASAGADTGENTDGEDEEDAFCDELDSIRKKSGIPVRPSQGVAEIKERMVDLKLAGQFKNVGDVSDEMKQW